MIKDQPQTTQADEERRYELAGIFIGAAFNIYAAENVTFGRLEPGAAVPFERFADELGLWAARPHSYPVNFFEGYAIDAALCVRGKDRGFFRKLCFFRQMSEFLPLAERPDTDYHRTEASVDDFLLRYRAEGRPYLKAQYALFEEILSEPWSYDAFALLPDPAFIQRRRQNQYVRAFLSRILVKPMRNGACVTNYFKRIGVVPSCLETIVRRERGRFWLWNGDPTDLDFRLAILSSMPFASLENARLMELLIARRKERPHL